MKKNVYVFIWGCVLNFKWLFCLLYCNVDSVFLFMFYEGVFNCWNCDYSKLYNREMYLISIWNINKFVILFWNV